MNSNLPFYFLLSFQAKNILMISFLRKREFKSQFFSSEIKSGKRNVLSPLYLSLFLCSSFVSISLSFSSTRVCPLFLAYSHLFLLVWRFSFLLFFIIFPKLEYSWWLLKSKRKYQPLSLSLSFSSAFTLFHSLFHFLWKKSLERDGKKLYWSFSTSIGEERVEFISKNKKCNDNVSTFWKWKYYEYPRGKQRWRRRGMGPPSIFCLHRPSLVFCIT